LLFDPAHSSLYGEHTAPVLGSPKLRLAWHFRVSPRSPTAKSGFNLQPMFQPVSIAMPGHEQDLFTMPHPGIVTVL
jgi:hypothetical protein